MVCLFSSLIPCCFLLPYFHGNLCSLTIHFKQQQCAPFPHPSSIRKVLLSLRIQHKCQHTSLGTDVGTWRETSSLSALVQYHLLECHLFYYCKRLCMCFSHTNMGPLLKQSIVQSMDMFAQGIQNGLFSLHTSFLFMISLGTSLNSRRAPVPLLKGSLVQVRSIQDKLSFD